jgi:hypothetical protein
MTRREGGSEGGREGAVNDSTARERERERRAGDTKTNIYNHFTIFCHTSFFVSEGQQRRGDE